MNFRALIFSILFSFPAIVFADISKVVVLDSDFKVQKTINNEADLRAFQKLWENKDGKWTQRKILMRYKLDITEDGKSNRWLYSEKGWATILSMKVSKQYQVNSIELNKILGIED